MWLNIFISSWKWPKKIPTLVSIVLQSLYDQTSNSSGQLQGLFTTKYVVWCPNSDVYKLGINLYLQIVWCWIIVFIKDWRKIFNKSLEYFSMQHHCTGILVLLEIKDIVFALLCIACKAFIVRKLIPWCWVYFLLFSGRDVILGTHQLL